MAQGLRIRLGNRENRCGFTFGAVDRGLFFTFGASDGGFALTGGNVDLLLFTAFGSGDQRAFFTFGGNLCLHCAQNFCRWNEVFDLIAQDFHAPVGGGFVQCADHLRVNHFAFFKGAIQFEFTDYATQAGLRQLGNREHKVRRAVRGFHRVGDLEINHAVHLQLRVVTGDTDLAGDIHRDFFERMAVGHAVNERHNDVQTGQKGTVVFTKALQHPRTLLRNDLYGLRDKDDGENQNNKR